MSRGLDFEKAAAARRVKERGPEHLHSSGLAMVRRAIDGRHATRLQATLERWRREPSIEAQVEANAAARAEREEWLRWNLDFE